MTDRVLGEAKTYDDLIEVYRARIAELGVTYATVDDLSGLQSGYVGKILGDGRVKALGPLSMGLLNTTLAIKFVVVEDPVTLLQMAQKWELRIRPASMPSRASTRAMERFKPIVTQALNSERAALGGRARALKLTPARRRAIAKRAARARWRRSKQSS